MNKFTNKFKIENMDDIKRYEHVSSKVSNQYVPIKTSDFVQTLTSNFTLVGGRQYRAGSTGHYVTMSKGENTSIMLYIENSFDRTMSLRMSFKYGDFVFGRIKQIHRGKPALDMIGTIDEINSWYNNAVGSIDALRVLDLDKSDMKNIAELVFKSRGVSLNIITNMRYNHSTALEFIEYMVKGIKMGKFIRLSAKGEPKLLKPVTQESLLVTINAKIWNYLAKNNPELYI